MSLESVIEPALAGADKHLWASTTRSLRVDGMVTSLRLENIFWQTLEDLAQQQDIPLSKFVTELFHLSTDPKFQAINFTSYLRVCCGLWLKAGLPKI